MKIGEGRIIATTAAGLILALVLAGGCASPGPIAARNSKFGALRTSVAHLEHENLQLKRELADLQVENRKATDRLVQADAEKDDLATRLDDARRAIRGEGETSLADTSPPASPLPERRREGSRTSPAGRASRPNRKPPFARIPNRIEDEQAPANPEDEPEPNPSSYRPSRRGELGPTSRLDRPSRWLPVGERERAMR